MVLKHNTKDNNIYRALSVAKRSSKVNLKYILKSRIEQAWYWHSCDDDVRDQRSPLLSGQRVYSSSSNESDKGSLLQTWDLASLLKSINLYF